MLSGFRALPIWALPVLGGPQLHGRCAAEALGHDTAVWAVMLRRGAPVSTGGAIWSAAQVMVFTVFGVVFGSPDASPVRRDLDGGDRDDDVWVDTGRFAEPTELSGAGF